MKNSLFLALVLAAGLAPAAPDATSIVHAGWPAGRVDPMRYGQFIEHLGSCIRGGLFDAGSPLANEDALRSGPDRCTPTRQTAYSPLMKAA